MSINKQAKRYEELDALRGIAALLVVFFHFTLGRSEAKLGFKLGTTGVDLFFIISGFVIFMSLTRVKCSLEFIINRVSRLYPTYWACVSFLFILISIYSVYRNQDVPFVKYLGNMTMFQYYLGVPDLDGPYWTMIIEMIFYIGILFLFHFKLIKFLDIIGITLSISLVAITFFFDSTTVQKIVHAIPLLPFIPLFYAGTVFYKIYLENSQLIKRYIFLIICLVSQILIFEYAGRSFAFINQLEYAGMLIVYFFVFSLFVNNKLGFIVSKGTLFLGKISFALYLVHQYISIGFIIPYLTKHLDVNFWVASLLVALPVVVLIATLITFYIEVPLGKKMKHSLQVFIKK